MNLAYVSDSLDGLCAAAQRWGGTPDTVRTCGLLIRNQLLYPAELRGHGATRYIAAGPNVNGGAMFTRLVVPALVVLTSACVESRVTETWESLPGAQSLTIRSDRGDVEIDGRTGRDAVFVEADLFGRAMGKDKAEERRNGTSVTFAEENNVVTIDARSQFTQAGVTLDADVPLVLNLDVSTERGDFTATDVEGTHVVDVNRIWNSFLRGELDADVGAGGIDLELWPYEDATVVINTTGDLRLALPAFGPYDIVIETGFDTELSVADLGFDELIDDGGRLIARRFPATALIDIRATGDSVRIVEAF